MAADGSTWLISDMVYIPWFAPFWVSQTISWSLSINRYIPELIFQAFYGWGWALRCFLEEYPCKCWHSDLNPTNFIDCCGGFKPPNFIPGISGVEQHLGMLCCILCCVFLKDDPLQNGLVNMLWMNIEESLGLLVDIFDMIPQFQEVASKKVPSPI